ncbi:MULTISPECIES: aminotransferase class V-fold PLP-dependent enzyme [Aeromonas]|jgi:cysteine sulfinate desulfinase/cysteine desulfurase/selenocysteine lyase|uniref:Cysteine desulfurase n=1 Tax=Aeromonas veronii TaxID=654 RepID=A0A2T4N2N4_AERVE|nr:SufS family cysteine desulfurase [Aeromonas veronii]AXV21348.1 cysteine desulfurase CsdA [Aeromonas veronii]MBA2796927.1 SufS family cysteine desulfurase [Aeromonas veronii]MCX0445683.1 SufS family cysteine desulfurase [Aeromonas veronii]PTH81089.1 cysteine desulfurase CsdA [Aeromonas veronii]RDE60683.1 SufS family cysteine desulfurase [Aeromonas veronii]
MNQQQHDQLRSQFPALAQEVNGHPLVYLDNAATTQKPQTVLDAIVHYYGADNANVHRAAHALSGRATRAFEAARETVSCFINAPRSHEVIWTRGTTEAINLVAQSWGMSELKAGDEIILSTLEHHANIVPWQLVAQRTGAVIRVIPLDERGDLDLAAYHAMLGPRTRLVSLAHVSNALGTVNPVKEIVAAAKAVGAVTLIDGAQAVAHLDVDVQAIGCDFYAFSGHKLYGPTGIGVLWGRTELLERMPPWQAGGEMIDRVSFSRTTFNTLPFKFEAGTPHIAGAIGLAAAIDFVMAQDLQWLAQHEQALTDYLVAGLQQVPGLRLVGEPGQRAGAVSFLLDDIHPQDAATLLDMQGIALRVGHHCAMPLMESLGIGGTMRASLACYNNRDDVDALLAALHKLSDFF